MVGGKFKGKNFSWIEGQEPLLCFQSDKRDELVHGIEVCLKSGMRECIELK